MSAHALPMLYFNLGGEMLYVLDQRLRAQNVEQMKGKKVMDDIVNTMFNSNFMEELFKPQAMYTRHSMRTIFDRLVHSSIMRVDSDSMEKLYDLMIMAFKYQTVKCSNPKDLLQVTVNHLDNVLTFVSSNSAVRKSVTDIFHRTVDLYSDMSVGELVTIKQFILAFLQDSRNKVSIFVNSNSQNQDGTFVIPTSGPVPFGSDVPGLIHYLKEKQDDKFTVGASFGKCKLADYSSVRIGGPRCTNLGTNLYANDYNYDLVTQNSYQFSHQNLAKAELNLLADLVGSTKTVDRGESFTLNLFNDNESNDNDTTKAATVAPVESSCNTISIDAVKSGREELSKIMSDFTITPSKKDKSNKSDLLSLMDDT